MASVMSDIDTIWTISLHRIWCEYHISRETIDVSYRKIFRWIYSIPFELDAWNLCHVWNQGFLFRCFGSSKEQQHQMQLVLRSRETIFVRSSW